MSYWYDSVEFDVLKGLTLTRVENSGDKIDFYTTEGKHYSLYHEGECCEDVWIEDIVGDLDDLVGSEILVADEVSSRDSAMLPKKYDGVTNDDYLPPSSTWTFFKLATIKGYVDIRFFGESNGYYSEGADLHEIPPDSEVA